MQPSPSASKPVAFWNGQASCASNTPSTSAPSKTRLYARPSTRMNVLPPLSILEQVYVRVVGASGKPLNASGPLGQSSTTCEIDRSVAPQLGRPLPSTRPGLSTMQAWRDPVLLFT